MKLGETWGIWVVIRTSTSVMMWPEQHEQHEGIEKTIDLPKSYFCWPDLDQFAVEREITQ